uniref:Uncharacterized protein n=1 Tax=Onchocerca volvulus TaxID=6282 RepID=A0A8R1XKS3_ONCVO
MHVFMKLRRLFRLSTKKCGRHNQSMLFLQVEEAILRDEDLVNKLSIDLKFEIEQIIRKLSSSLSLLEIEISVEF